MKKLLEHLNLITIYISKYAKILSNKSRQTIANAESKNRESPKTMNPQD